tara:strand:- start:1066 stop:1518 length:453 start_codon:yes stop_codon:yes gene_type:complete
MLKKNFIILLFIFISGCGYTPIYSNLNNDQFNIILIKTTGNSEINNLIQNKLKKYEGNTNKKSFNIILKTEYKKIIVAKNSDGVASDYELVINANFAINDGETSKNIVIQEKFKIKKNDNVFEERSYENSIKRNFADLIVQKLITQLLSY